MRNLMSVAFWGSVLSILWMFAGHAWAGATLGIFVAAWLVLAIAAVLDLIG